jgi:hypothetical protein
MLVTGKSIAKRPRLLPHLSLVTCHLGHKTVCKCFTGNGLDSDYNPDYMSSGLSPDYYSTNYYIYLSDTSSQ